MTDNDDHRTESDSPAALRGVIEHLLDQTEGEDQVNLDDVFAAFSGRLYGPLLLVPSLVLVTPLGGIPGMPVIVALVLVLIAGQRVLGRSRPWLPRRIRERSVSREKLERAFSKLRPAAKVVDAVIRPRLAFLVEGMMERVLALAILAVGLSVPIFGFVPFAAAIPGLAAVLLSLAITGRDGLLVLASALVIAAGIVGPIWMNGAL